MSRQDLIREYDQTSKAVKIYRASKVKMGVQFDLLVEKLKALDSQIVSMDNKYNN